jgi:RNA polymerase primary sigma factor
MSKVMKISCKKAEIIEQGLQAVNRSGQIAPESCQALSEMLQDDRGGSPDRALIEASNAPLVKSLLEKLDDRQRKILELRFGLDDETARRRTYKEIGKIVGLTRERVRQLEKQALEILRGQAGQML